MKFRSWRGTTLGGAGFDNMIVEKLVIQKFWKNIVFELKRRNEKCVREIQCKILFFTSAEEAKIALSVYDIIWNCVDGFEDEDGSEVDMKL
jgi:hypothetical protein